MCGTKPKVRLASFRLAARQLFSCPVASFISLTHARRQRSGFRATRYSRTSGSCSDGYIEPSRDPSLYSYGWSHFGHDLSPLPPDARVLDFSPPLAPLVIGRGRDVSLFDRVFSSPYARGSRSSSSSSYFLFRVLRMFDLAEIVSCRLVIITSRAFVFLLLAVSMVEKKDRNRMG